VGATPRQVADRYVDALVDLDPVTATSLGVRPLEDRLPDLSPVGQEALDALARATLAELDAAEAEAAEVQQAGQTGQAGLDGDDRRCARLLRERLEADLAASALGEHLRAVRNLGSPVHVVRSVFTMMPTDTDEQWEALARRLAAVPAALAGYAASLETGSARGLLAAPRQVEVVAGQLAEWLGPAGGRSWFADVVAPGPRHLRGPLDAGAGAATDAVAQLRRYLLADYAPRTAGVPDAVGPERYAVAVRGSTGADLDLADAYAYGWAEVRRLEAEVAAQAELVRPGAGPAAAMAWLEEHGPAVEGVEAVRERLQQMMDTAIADLDGAAVDLADPIRVVEARIAPPGSAAAPYYTRPSLDFTRPGRTWLPTLGRTRFPLWNLVSTWYHEGVPGHHLQLAQWVLVSPRLSAYQTSVGTISANVEGWALYAERLMDELGYLTDPGARLGYLDAQMMRAVRVVVDIGLHLGLRVPDDATGDLAAAAGRVWDPLLARAFFGARSGRPAAFLDSEVDRYLGRPAQAIGYKLGERAWLAGREAARAAAAAQGRAFDARAWHMAALSQGSLGLADLEAELAAL
jgi:uncharacterized protein (DUF885 family)